LQNGAEFFTHARVTTLSKGKLEVTAVGSKSAVIPPENLIVIHYHRFNGAYDDQALWTWDASGHITPPENDITPVGRDDFGLVFHLDHAKYQGTPVIGFIPRTGHDWNRRDGGDKHWSPLMGREIWIVQTRAEVYTTKPDLSPSISCAYFDALDRVGILLATPVVNDSLTPADIEIRSAGGHRIEVDKIVYHSAPHMARSFALDVTTKEPLEVEQQYRVAVAGFSGFKTAKLRGILDNRDLFYDAVTPLGATYTPTGTTFRIFAPCSTAVGVVLYSAASGKKGRTVHPMFKLGKGIWEATVAGDLDGRYYMLELMDADAGTTEEVMDPYAINTVQSNTRARVTDLAKTNPPGWELTRTGPKVEVLQDCTIYEIHVRDFSIAENSGTQNRGRYAAFAETGTQLPGETLATGLDHLVELGISHVQLLPVHDSEGDETNYQYNWGYMTAAFFSPEGSYASNINDGSRISELKLLVAALHAKGIGVVLDVVFNHTTNDAPFFKIAPDYYYRHWSIGGFSNGSGCGNDFRTEAPMVRRLVIDSLKYWLTEFGVDGFRFDLMGLLDAETMREAEHVLRAINPSVLLYGEPWSADHSPMPQPANKDGIRGTGIAAFNDDFRNGLKGSPDGEHPGFIQRGWNSDSVRAGIGAYGWPEGPWQTINYMTCHDNLVLFDKLKLSLPGATEESSIAAMKLGYLILYTAQGVPFIHGGEEFARSKGGHHNSYNAPDSVNQVDWSLKAKHHDLFQYVRDLIALRKAHPIFRLRSREEVQRCLQIVETGNWRTLQYMLDGRHLDAERWSRICVVVNTEDAIANEFKLPEGLWSLVFDEKGLVEPPTAPAGEEKIVVPPKTAWILCEITKATDKV